ncbi:MAPEG family protein [Synechococcus sp. CCY9201]|uniref:MAPEG family protein n=1 Tax=Synechococcus sp. CCY9201 TaxID=174697 RepID=UPI002B216E79|nr:MAPEG family protein [Synechococcus sp. CCY9201]MEA5475903.1 MAPEG family protein [Synechococcus sp. CCY9201]
MSLPPLPALVTILALVLYQATALLVGRARVQHHVKPPATTGPEGFERALRVQQNTLEQLVFFLPAFWMAVALNQAGVACALGFVWIGARIAYAVGYMQAPDKRGPGFGIAFLVSVALLVMAFVGVVAQLG